MPSRLNSGIEHLSHAYILRDAEGWYTLTALWQAIRLRGQTRQETAHDPIRSGSTTRARPRFRRQYVQLIARRVRERHAFARIVRHDITAERVRELNPLA